MEANEFKKLRVAICKNQVEIRKLHDDTRKWMKYAILSVCEELGGNIYLSNGVFECSDFYGLCILYDGGNHPEYASDCSHDVYSFGARRNEKGGVTVFAEIDETKEYDDERMPLFDIEALYEAAMFAYDNKEEYIAESLTYDESKMP